MNKYIKFFPTVALSMLFASQAYGQMSNEPAWRVVNPQRDMLVPSYNQESNPFPWETVPKVEKIIEIDYEAIEKAEARALLIRDLREILKQKKTYRVNFGGFMPKGYLKGDGGTWVLMAGEWRNKGDRLNVPILGTEIVLDKLNSLKGIDADVGAEFEEEIFKNMPRTKKIGVEIITITPEFIRVRDDLNRVYRLKIQDNINY